MNWSRLNMFNPNYSIFYLIKKFFFFLFYNQARYIAVSVNKREKQN